MAPRSGLSAVARRLYWRRLRSGAGAGAAVSAPSDRPVELLSATGFYLATDQSIPVGYTPDYPGSGDSEGNQLVTSEGDLFIYG